MRKRRETDISKYTGVREGMSSTPIRKPNIIGGFFRGIFKLIFTFLCVGFVAGVIAFVSIAVYVMSVASEPTGINLAARSLNQTSFIYVQNPDSGEFEQYQTLYNTENRIWVDNQDIPKAMKNAVVAIEDKRFATHKGVDWQRTASAIINLGTGGSTFGGSTITQQLVKNITDDDDVSLTRKLREICRALKLEKEYTKDQILEAYLNVVNFGNNCQGVEAASELYFGKPISECSIAECAAIAGITQNPSKWNPLVYPENNKIRRDLIIDEMHTQGKITNEEYIQAIKDSSNMEFVGFQFNDDDEDESYVQNWYIDELFYDAAEDLAEYLGISESAASEKLYTEGLKIYCAMDKRAQDMIESAAINVDKSSDSDLQIAMTLMGFDGRVIASVGSSNKKEGALNWNRATMSALQPGSSIKPVVVYPYAIDNELMYFSSMVDDKPLEKYRIDENGNWVEGPGNWYPGNKGRMLLPDAIEISSNNTAAQAMEMIGGPVVAYKQVVTKMGFAHLDENDANISGGLSIGGLTGGVTVREMAAAYTYMGNGGRYYKPYTYYYITDSEDKVIIDNRDNVPKQAYSPETAAIMNRLLHYNITNCANTQAHHARVSGWDIIGKTGTTNSDKDSWFCGMSPYATLAVWTGFDNPHTISDTSIAAKSFSKVMSSYLEDKEEKEYSFPDTLIEAQYDPATGLIITTDNPSGKYVGYYTEDNMPSSSNWGGDYVQYQLGYTSSSNSNSNYDNYNNYDNNIYETTPVVTIPDTSIDVTVPEDPTPTETGPGEDPVATVHGGGDEPIDDPVVSVPSDGGDTGGGNEHGGENHTAQ